MKLYAYTLPTVAEKSGWLKIGETNGNVEKRVKQQGHELNLQIEIVWQDAVITERSHIDKMLHRWLEQQGLQIAQFEDTGADSEWIKCNVDDVKKAYTAVKEQLHADEIKREEVGNQFYLEIRNWFYWVAKTGDDPYSVAEPEYTLRLIVRLMFVFFLKEKGLVPKELFEENWVKVNLQENEEHRYYNAVLRNLFFYSLNTPQNQRGELEHKKLAKNLTRIKDVFKQIPFLNGGLFNVHPGDDFPINDDYFFSESRTRYIKELDGDYKVEGIIRLLSKYQFKTELDLIDAAEYTKTIDPEFIGKVFESLLACIDADSKESRRKITGSFYTPREIVSYMVNESLDEYLKTNNELLNVKILDPACGSGAFPCGVMNEIMQRIDPNKELSQMERYRKKLDILRNVIYGVDIQPMAVQIAILRLFLSLIQEIVPDKKKDNFGIEPLPNLETKFVCANTLIGLKYEKQGQLQAPVVKQTVKQLQETRSQYFTATAVSEKERLKKYDETLRETLSIAMEADGEFGHATALRLAQWNPYDQTKSAEFFDSMWMFGIDNFDIVIGNPPYRQLQKNGGTLAKQYEKSDYETFTKGGDIYCLFYERAWQLLPDNGICCFITSNKWMRAGYGEKLRNFLAKKTNPQLLLDFDGVKVFESATVDTNILLYRKEPNEGKCIAVSPRDEESDTNKSKLPFGIFIDTQTVNFNTSDAWVILSPYERRIKTKIEAIGKPLKDWDIQIKIGVNTGCDKAFIIDKETKDVLCGKDPKSTEIIKPILRGRDIKRYGYEFADLWLITTYPALKINIDDYSAVKQHLLNYGKKQLEQSGKKGSRKKSSNQWYEHADTLLYWQDFEKPKIIWSDISTEPSFVFVDKAICLGHTAYMITGLPKCYVGILNSKIVEWYVPTIATDLGSGTRYMKQFIQNLPIPVLDTAGVMTLSDLVERRLNGEDVDEKIDALVYELYGLTAEEIAVVESSNPQR
ncbi:hypothetical protein FACS1894170_08710 [Planctomycetales bacterium]|nr:hypothetical protein FACS1894170_08710 [Planctomycetales bacterium]